jgi:hypothetical protein
MGKKSKKKKSNIDWDALVCTDEAGWQTGDAAMALDGDDDAAGLTGGGGGAAAAAAASGGGDSEMGGPTGGGKKSREFDEDGRSFGENVLRREARRDNPGVEPNQQPDSVTSTIYHPCDNPHKQARRGAAASAATAPRPWTLRMAEGGWACKRAAACESTGILKLLTAGSGCRDAASNDLRS